MKLPSLSLALICLSVGFAGLATGQTLSRIAGGIDESSTVALSGNVHPLVATAGGSEVADDATPMEHMILFLKGDAGQEENLAKLITQQNDPNSASYHQYLSPKDFGAKFGVGQTDLATVSAWLQGQGFTVEELPPGNRSIVFSGTAGQVASTFQTEIRKYNINGALHYANATDPQIPAALAGVVGGIVKLHDFKYGRSITAPKSISPEQLAHPQFTNGSSHYLAPADYGTIYDINPTYSAGINGTGQTIAVLARSNIYLSDVQSFRSSFGLKENDPQFVITNSNPGVLEGDSVETTLDTEWSGAVAPSATVKVIISASTNTSDGIDLSALYAVTNNVAPIISLSYGSCEAAMGSSELAFYNSLWKQAAAQGQTVLVSAGDSGAAGCDYGSVAMYGQAVNGLCSSPYSTCVGGTEFAEGNNPGQYWLPGNNSTYGSAISYIPETVWNESGTVSGGSDLWAGGGGASIIYSKPSWQAGTGVPADGKRDVPDLSLAAAGHDGYLIWLYGSLNSVGGTSAAAPSFAGIMALVDQKTNAKQGLINSTIYPLATKQASGGAAVFHDIVAGNNSVPGQTGLSATVGYDRASGLGSVDVNLLVNHWTDASTTATSLTLSASSTSVTVTQGQSGQVTITSAATSLNAAVALTVTGAPAGITMTLSAASVASPGSGSVTLTIAASSSVSPGTYSFTVKGTGGNQTATVPISVVVPTPTFILSPNSASLTAVAGASVQTSAATTPQNGFSATVALTATGLPSGMTAAFSSSSITGAKGGSSTITFSVAKTVNAGSYSCKILATGGGITQTESVQLTVTVPTFTLATSVNSVSAVAGSHTQLTVLTTAQNGFNSAVALSVSGLPTGVTATWSAPSLSSGAGTSTLTLTLASSVKAGSYGLSVVASGGGVTQTSSITLVAVVPSICNFVANPSSVSLTAGQQTSLGLSCAVTQGSFTGPLTVGVSGAPSGMTVQAGSLTAGSSSSLSISTASSVAAGKYSLSLTASGSGYTHTVSVPVTVAAADTFTLTASANSLSVKNGATGQVSITTQNVGVFNSAVSLGVSGLPSGVTVAWSKTSIAAPGNGSATATFTVGSSATPGNYSVSVTASGGGITQTFPIGFSVAATPNFTLILNATSLTVQQGASGTITASTGNYTGGFNGQMVMSFSGLSSGMNYSVVGATAVNNLVNISLAFSVPPSMPVGTYPITVTDTGNSGNAATGNGVSHSAIFNLVVTAASQLRNSVNARQP